MFYTGKGDDGMTSTFGCCDQRISKSSAITEALGALDEVNSFLGIVKVRSCASEIVVCVVDGAARGVADIMDDLQHDLFVVQAELAGANKHISVERVREMERIINTIETEIPPIKSFFVCGGVEIATLLDFSRTLARRAERRVVSVVEEGAVIVGESTIVYLNRLSSLLYAIARQVNHKSGITEESPRYR